jgi:anti-anti-sigma factor
MKNSNVKAIEARRRSEQATYTVRLAHAEYGSLDGEKLARLRRLLLYVAAHNVDRRLVLDLSNVQYFGAGFVSVLVDTWDVLNKADRRLVLSGLTPHCARLIRTLHMDKLFDICPAPDTALESLGPQVAFAKHQSSAAAVHVHFSEVAWNPDMVRAEYFGADGVPIRSVIRPRRRPHG